MASETSICNRALQRLGAKRIVSLTEGSVNSKACLAAYAARRDALLRKHRWNFAIDRATLAADAVAPAWGRANAFELPPTSLMPIPPYPEQNLNDRDWVVEGKKILTNEQAPLYVRFIKQVTDPNEMDPIFREVLSADLAVELCEELTQSNTKKDRLEEDLKRELADARKANAFEKVLGEPATSPFVSKRA